jgi:hypothetical protein
LIPKVANSQGQAEVAVEFIRSDPSKPEEMANCEKLAALIKPAISQVVNAGCLKAGDVCKRVLPVVRAVYGEEQCFNASYHHALACEFYKVRPKKGDPHPEKTNIEMCQYDAAHKDLCVYRKMGHVSDRGDEETGAVPETPGFQTCSEGRFAKVGNIVIVNLHLRGRLIIRF